MADAAAPSKNSKRNKIIAIVVILLIVIGFGWWMFSGSSLGKWTEYPDQDIAGSDISNESNVTLDQAKAKAIKLNAASFVYYPNQRRAWYKSSAAGMSNKWTTETTTVYVKQ